MKTYIIPIFAILVAGVLSWAAWQEEGGVPSFSREPHVAMEDVVLPVVWGDIGVRLVEKGVIDWERFASIYESRGGLGEEEALLKGGMELKEIRMTAENSGELLNILWAFGLANKNEILEKGPMTDPRYGGAENFASTGGWTIAKGDAMEHYSAYELVKLTEDQQKKVERVSQGIYRPCCGNSTYFPDCNHGMAMLGLLELMAANNVSENEMYEVAYRVNRLWFPSTYETIDTYVKERGLENKVTAKELLGIEYSSGQGYQNILSQVKNLPKPQGASCGV